MTRRSIDPTTAAAWLLLTLAAGIGWWAIWRITHTIGGWL